MCACTTEHVWIGGQLIGVNSPPTTWVPRIELGSSGWQWVPLPSESSQWLLVLVHILSRPHPALADISRVYTACAGTLPRNTGSLQDKACDWKASQLSAGTDYLLRIIRRRCLSQWSGHWGCVALGEGGYTIGAFSPSFQKVAWSRRAGMNGRGLNSQAPQCFFTLWEFLNSISKYILTFTQKWELSWRYWQLGTIKFLHENFQSIAQMRSKIKQRASISTPKQLSHKCINGMHTWNS